jgi:hypothetical protein
MDTTAGPRDLVHFISGKPVQGGVAYVAALCSRDYGFGASQVYGAFDLSNPNTMWDVLVVTHELGHNFGSPHTHCYDPPVDRCYAAEPGCYDGAVVPSQGTIMSYCHLLRGVAGVDLAFGKVVSGRIGTTVEAASCLVAGAPSTTTTTSSSTTSTRATTSSTTTPPPPSATTTSTTVRRPTTTSTSTTVRRPATTSTSLPPSGDADADGVTDVLDACPGTPAGDLVDASGCSVCPCAAMRDGTPWPSRNAYLRCVRTELRGRAEGGAVSRTSLRGLSRQMRLSTCGRATMTRCCVYAAPDGAVGSCRVIRAWRCDAGRLGAHHAWDAGPGLCAPSPC